MPFQTDIPQHPSEADLYPALTYNPELFERHLDGFDLSADLRSEVLESLWLVVVSFVDMGFHIHPLQLVDGCTLEMERDSEGVLALNPVPNINNPDSVRSSFERVRIGATNVPE